MRVVYFTHSLASCWNHGNAHFLRGILDELVERGHEVQVYEPQGAWSLTNLLADHGEAGLDAYHRAYPQLSSRTYSGADDVAQLAEDADLVLVHEWNARETVAALGRARARGAPYRLLFHDTHHRGVSAPAEMEAYRLEDYDGVLAFGEALAEVYRSRGWGNRVWTWHEAADVRRFHPPEQPVERHGLVWIGNWGDGERTQELQEFLFRSAQAAGLPLDVYGVRYPVEALHTLGQFGAHYHGWAPNAAAPKIFANHLATVHVPRKYYATMLRGIPTIRVFEALACGIPLVSAPWEDSEGLFRPGSDYLVAQDGDEMTRLLRAIGQEPALRDALAASGLETIRARHTCAHRVDELLSVFAQLSPTPSPAGELA
jgi:spore maturation protein CgeB